MTNDVIKELASERQELSPFHEQMLREAKALVKGSRSKMNEYYDSWDLQDNIFKGIKQPDKEDREQAIKGQPTKFVVPNTFAQCMTFTSFLFLMYKQNTRLFELLPNPNSAFGQHREDCELLLERDMRYNEECKLMFQHLLDVARFGPSVMECSWTRKVSRIYAPTEPSLATVNGVQLASNPGSDWQDVLKYEGNLVRSVSPYRFFPDTAFPISDFQKGRFCAAEETYSLEELQELESAGEVAGVDHIQPLPQDYSELRGGATRMQFEVNSRYNQEWGNRNKKAPVLVTKMQRWIVPSKYLLGGEEKLGPEDFPVLYHLWYANDNRLIRIEPCRWWHNEFGWTVSQFTPDMHETINLGLANLVDHLQNVISWLINSRIRDVRRNVFGRNLINPRFVDTKTLDGDGDVYLRKDVTATFDRALMPMPMNNVTQGHMSDSEMLGGVMRMVTGVGENMSGRVNTGRRSAREIGDTNAGGAGRMKIHGQIIWEPGFGRLGRLMLSNLRQALTLESFQDCLGDGNVDAVTGVNDLQERFTTFKSTPKKVAKGHDYFMFDSTTASEKGQLATSLQELLSAIMANPVAAQLLDVDPKALLDEVQLLRGAGPIKRFSQQRPGGAPPQILPQPGVAA